LLAVWASFRDDVAVDPIAVLRLIGVANVNAVVPFGVNVAAAFVIGLPDDVAVADVAAADGTAVDVPPVAVASAAIVPVAVVAAVEYEAELVALDLVTFETWP
jgi:hypothetical protein